MADNLHVLETGYDHTGYLEMAARSGRILAEMSHEGSELIGHVSIGVYSDGSYSCGFKMPDDQPFMGPTLFCAFVKEVIEREMTGKLAADDYAKEYLL